MDVHNKWGEKMKTLLICIFVIGVSVFFIGAGIGIAWMAIEDTALGRAIDEAVGETNEDNRRLDNLKTLIDVTNWCLDGLQFAMASGYGRPEYSMAEISYTAQCALDEYGTWIADTLDEYVNGSRSEKPNNCEHITEDGVTCAKYPACGDCLDNPLNKVKGSERLVKGKDEPQTEMTTEQVVNELLSIKKILDDGKMPKQRCGNCKHLTYRWNKTWCDIKCENPHDMVCDKWKRSE